MLMLMLAVGARPLRLGRGVLGGGPNFFMAKVGMPFPSRGFFSMAEKK
jgi:hypothetical protein